MTADELRFIASEKLRESSAHQLFETGKTEKNVWYWPTTRVQDPAAEAGFSHTDVLIGCEVRVGEGDAVVLEALVGRREYGSTACFLPLPGIASELAWAANSMASMLESVRSQDL